MYFFIRDQGLLILLSMFVISGNRWLLFIFARAAKQSTKYQIRQLQTSVHLHTTDIDFWQFAQLEIKWITVHKILICSTAAAVWNFRIRIPISHRVSLVTRPKSIADTSNLWKLQKWFTLYCGVIKLFEWKVSTAKYFQKSIFLLQGSFKKYLENTR